MDYGTPPAQIPAVEPWVDAEAVAAHLGFKPDHIRKLARSGQIPGRSFQNGRRQYWRFKISEIDAACDSLIDKQAHITIRQAMPTISAVLDMAAQA